MPVPERFRAFVVSRDAQDRLQSGVTEVSESQLPAGDVLIRVQYSSANFKDALSHSGHRGVTTQFPHVPGIDAVGIVERSRSTEYPPGVSVVVTGHNLGMNHWGGYAEYLSVPLDWVVALPDEMTSRQCMQLGTAGLTAAQSVQALLHHGTKPTDGPILVTGAGGGVAVIAIRLLAHLGFEVLGSTRRAKDLGEQIRALGAKDVIAADQLPTSDSPLLRERWAAVIDTVGGKGLDGLLKSVKYTGIVTTCGMLGGDSFGSSVFPFILRGVVLHGIDSARMPSEQRVRIWRRLATEWRVDLNECSGEVGLDELEPTLNALLAGSHFGRTVVRVGATS